MVCGFFFYQASYIYCIFIWVFPFYFWLFAKRMSFNPQNELLKKYLLWKNSLNQIKWNQMLNSYSSEMAENCCLGIFEVLYRIRKAYKMPRNLRKGFWSLFNSWLFLTSYFCMCPYRESNPQPLCIETDTLTNWASLPGFIYNYK